MTIPNANGSPLFVRHFKAMENHKAAIFCLHGYAEHSGRYAKTAKFFNESGFDFFSFDHHGHGKSYGRKGLVESWELLLDDASHVLNEIQKKHPEIEKWFLLGHSMGGAVAALLAAEQKYEFVGMLLSAPLFDQVASNSKLTIAVGKFIASVMPNCGIIPFDADALSRDPEVIKAYKSDPLNYNGKLKARTGVQLLAMIEALKEIPTKIHIPLWIGHSTIDRLTSYKASRYYFEKMASENKTFKKYDGLFHELMNEPEKRVVLGEMLQWIQKRM